MQFPNKPQRHVKPGLLPRTYAPLVRTVASPQWQCCPRCNERVLFLYELGEAGRGMFCYRCLMALWSAIGNLAGFSFGRRKCKR
jgi:hypothetical protein